MQPTGTCIDLINALQHPYKVNDAMRLIDEIADLNCFDDYGRTPLTCASSNWRLNGVAARLIEKGADIDLPHKNSGESPLIIACSTRCNETAELLIKKGAALNKVANNGDTALDLCFTQSQFDPVPQEMEVVGRLIKKHGGLHSYELRKQRENERKQLENESEQREKERLMAARVAPAKPSRGLFSKARALFSKARGLFSKAKKLEGGRRTRKHRSRRRHTRKH